MTTTGTPILGVMILSFFSVASCSNIRRFRDEGIGVNYGRLGSNLPTPQFVPALLRSLSINVKHVKIFDMDTDITKSLANTGISISLCVPNQHVPTLALNYSESERLVRNFILPYHKSTKIRTISMGNEISLVGKLSHSVVPAMANLHRALRKFRLNDIAVSTTHSNAVLAKQFPPSLAVFLEAIVRPVLLPMLRFLNRTGGPFMINLYPYFTYKESYPLIPLEFALFRARRPQSWYTDPNSRLVYTNLFDAMLDAVYAGLSSLGFHSIPVVVAETGWPTKGGPGDHGASCDNARTFNQKLIDHFACRPRKGTPSKPWARVQTYIFALFDENQKRGPETERNWGVMYANGTQKYDLNGCVPVDPRRMRRKGNDAAYRYA